MSMPVISLLWATTCLLHPFMAASKECYAPDGSIAPPKFIPCIAFDHVDSMCCRLNDTFPDTCQPNGLCYWQETDSYYRDFCTDKTFESSNCLSKTMCDAAAGGSSNYTSKLTRCPGGSGNKFCCGDTNACCTEENTFNLEPTLVNFDSATTATVTTLVSATSHSKNGDTESSTKVAIGAGVGVSLGVLAGVMLGTGFWWGRRHTRAKHGALRAERNDLLSNTHSHTAGIQLADSKPVHEMDSNMPANRRQELPASGG